MSGLMKLLFYDLLTYVKTEVSSVAVCLILLTALGSKKCSKCGLVPLCIYQLHTIFEKKRKLLSMEQENCPQFWKNPNAIINPAHPFFVSGDTINFVCASLILG